MGLFDKLNKFLGVSESNQLHSNLTIDRKAVEKSQIDDMQKTPASDRYRERIYKKYYNAYPIKPFISLDFMFILIFK